MSRNEINRSIVPLILLVFALGCGSSFYSGVNDADNKVERGRLKFAKSALDLNTGTDPIYRKVRQYFFWTANNGLRLATNTSPRE
jgi:hypothetical protein